MRADFLSHTLKQIYPLRHENNMFWKSLTFWIVTSEDSFLQRQKGSFSSPKPVNHVESSEKTQNKIKTLCFMRIQRSKQVLDNIFNFITISQAKISRSSAPSLPRITKNRAAKPKLEEEWAHCQCWMGSHKTPTCPLRMQQKEHLRAFILADLFCPSS